MSVLEEAPQTGCRSRRMMEYNDEMVRRQSNENVREKRQVYFACTIEWKTLQSVTAHIQKLVLELMYPLPTDR